MHPYIFLDPFGTDQLGVTVIVAAPTGVTYAHQCGGYWTVIRRMEGFAVPIGDATAAQHLQEFFWQRFSGWPPVVERDAETRSDDRWTAVDLEQLDLLLGEYALWKTLPDGSSVEDERAWLRLDRSRLDELTEAWIPVSTLYGPGVLVYTNSD